MITMLLSQLLNPLRFIDLNQLLDDVLALVASILLGLIIYFSWKLYERRKTHLQTLRIIQPPKEILRSIKEKKTEKKKKQVTTTIPPAEEVAPHPGKMVHGNEDKKPNATTVQPKFADASVIQAEESTQPLPPLELSGNNIYTGKPNTNPPKGKQEVVNQTKKGNQPQSP